MKRKETLTFEYEHCGECPNVFAIADFPEHEWRCEKTKKHTPDLWGDIPEWCILEKVKK